MENSNLTTSIIETINSIFETLFSSIDTTIYSVLDELTFIDKNILNNSIFQKIFGSTGNNGLLVIANSLLVGFSLYYAIRLIYSYYMNLQIERPYQFIFKLLIFGIVMNCSYFICNQFIQINSFISDAIRTVASNIFGHDISFSELINKLNEKYEKEIKDEEIEIVHNPKVKLSSLIKRYILPFGISTIAIVIYQMIRFKKLGATKTLLTTIIVLMLIGLTYASLIAITRIPINKFIIPIGMAIYVITIIVLNMKYEKKLEENK